MAVTSDEVNLLVYRYLQESGFRHTAFTFATESQVLKSPAVISNSHVPHAALVTYLQRGLLYRQIEAHVTEDGAEIQCDAPFSLLVPHVCSRPTTIKNNQDHHHPHPNYATAAHHPAHTYQDSAMDDTSIPSGAYTTSPSSEYTSITPERAAPLATSNPNSSLAASSTSLPPSLSSSHASDRAIEIPESRVTKLEGHSSEVFICAWSPTQPLLASGSGDSTARIWRIPSGPCGDAPVDPPLVLKHFNKEQESSKDVTTLDWNAEGTMLATGSYDGLARIWSRNGALKNTLNRHKGPIFSLKWNKSGTSLLSGSVDKTAIIWDAATGDVRQQFEFHTAPTLDVDWRNDTCFATCSTDKMIFVCELGKNRPIKCFQGHQDEVNAIKWDPSGTLLASCSDDFTAKIWGLKQDRCLHDFEEHKKEIYTIKWSPTGAGSDNPNRNLVLASASFDASIKLWDVERGVCLYSLTKHTDPVYSVAFSPNGEYLASGSFDRCLHIWSVRDGRLVRTYKGSGGIFEVCWNSSGDKVAACFSNNCVSVIDVNMEREMEL